MEIRAAVVDPVGRNAYWSVRVREDGGEEGRIKELSSDETL